MATTTALVMRKWQRKRTNQEPLTYGQKPQEWAEGRIGGPYAPFAIYSVGKRGLKEVVGRQMAARGAKMQLRCFQNSSQHTYTDSQTWRLLLHFVMHAASHFLLGRMTPSSFVLRLCS